VIRPLLSERALLLDKTLVVGDLHIGLERELVREGIRVPPVLPDIRHRLEELIVAHKPKKLLILGDLKHAVAYVPYSEEAEIQNFLSGLEEKTEVEVIRGNHDGSLEELKGVKLLPSTGILVGEVGLFHGHAWPAAELLSADIWVFCHLHPMVTLTDYFGSLHKEPCWLFGEANKKVIEENYGKRVKPKLICMPAFNSFLGGVGLNELGTPEGFASCIDLENSEAVLLDGTRLGPIKNLPRL